MKTDTPPTTVLTALTASSEQRADVRRPKANFNPSRSPALARSAASRAALQTAPTPRPNAP